MKPLLIFLLSKKLRAHKGERDTARTFGGSDKATATPEERQPLFEMGATLLDEQKRYWTFKINKKDNIKTDKNEEEKFTYCKSFKER